MDEDDLTPTKLVYRVKLSANSKETVCVLCVQSISNPGCRRTLFTGSNKSQAGVNVEIPVGAKLDRERCLTDTIL